MQTYRLTNGEHVVISSDMSIRQYGEIMRAKGATEYEMGVLFRFLCEPNKNGGMIVQQTGIKIN